MEQKEQEQAGYSIACLWRAIELSTNRAQPIQCRTALGSAHAALLKALAGNAAVPEPPLG